MKWAVAFVWCFVLGSLIFLIYADFYFYHSDEKPDPARNVWDDLYYVWDTTKDLLIMILIYTVSGNKKWIIKPLFLYCSIRLLWAITVPFTNLDKNHPLTVTITFTALIIGVIILLLKDLRTFWQKEL